MRKNVTLITNNPCFQKTVGPSRLALLSGTALDVLIAARDSVHLGSFLLTHPLYGNLRPDQQPFRSVLLQNAPQKERGFPQTEENFLRKEGDFSAANYLESLSKIEEAVLLYQSYGGRLAAPENLPEAARDDYMFVDSELMRESLTQYGLL